MIAKIMKVRRGTAFTIILVFSVGLSSVAGVSWVHELRSIANSQPGSFRLQTVAAEEDHLVGRAAYFETGRAVTVKIDGVETLDGRFWPTVIAETANELNEDWQRLEQSKVSGRPVTYSLKFARANVMLYFNLDTFRPLLGKMRYGRIVLPSGMNSVFELQKLLPLDEKRESTPEGDWESTTIHGYLGDPLVKAPFFIAGFSFQEGHLRADCAYLAPETTTSTVIEGTKTPKKYTEEEDFWASATLEVANDPEGEWKPVGQSETPGEPSKLTIQPKEKKPITINVGVDLLRPLVSKFGYGRAVLKNGKAAAFEMKNLLPPNLRQDCDSNAKGDK